MTIYTTYGLIIHSDLPLPELQSLAKGKADVQIRLGKIDRSLLKTTGTEIDFYMNPEEAYFFWDEVGAFLVRGKEIIVDPLPGVEDRMIRLPLLGPVLAVLLHQRGFLVLHASAVAINDGVVAFLGTGGAGKSTMAATLYSRGHKLVADDVVALDLSDADNPMVLPAFPQVKLWPEAAASLGDDPQMLPKIHSQVEKRARRVSDRFLEQPLPLKRIYVLSGGPTPQIKTLQPQEAIAQLIGNSYTALFGKQSFQAMGAASHLHQCAHLASKVSICSLQRSHSLSLLPKVAQLVEEDLADATNLVMI